MSALKPKTAIAKIMDDMAAGKSMLGGSLDNADVGVAKEEEQDKFVKKTTSFEVNVTDPLQMKRIDPSLCRPWQFADRPEDEMGDIDSLAASIKEHGQQEPILVRPKFDQPGIEYEIIFGNRRWRACKRAELPILAIVKHVSDQEAALYQKEENDNRKELSDLARARSYKAQLEAGIFKNELELSKILGISPQNLNDIMSFNRIPEDLANAIPNLKNIARKTAVRLALLARDKKTLEGLIQLGTKIGEKEVTSANIEAHLSKIFNAGKSNQQPTIDFEDIKDANGKKMFLIKQASNGETIIKVSKRLQGSYEIKKMKDMIYQYLTESMN